MIDWANPRLRRLACDRVGELPSLHRRLSPPRAHRRGPPSTCGSAALRTSAANPNSGAFSVYAAKAMGRTAGATVGWLWWLQLVVVIAAVVIGGGSLHGGEGSVPGTLIGAFIMGLLSNGSDLLGTNPYWQQVIIGAVIILAVSVDELRKRRMVK